MEYTKLKQIKAIQSALQQHYLENPHLLEEKRKREAIESLISGVSAGVVTKLLTGPKLPSAYKLLPVSAGLTAGGVVAFINAAARNRDYARAQGIDTNLLRTYAEPINEKGEKYFE